ncbi:DUF3850 domain-containing protein [Achromobacter aegrifaciens]|uniref:DUF3850 domain-containing protein n=1 Tax=Achromobacter aegrifaciens TaxID=1287736 RepID=UPI0027B8E0E3|nr:DUF3850 domain-containing protein [Achromobacter aegrifaciens]WLW63635.1 DUF3850 domain-containing protein [Achromobacter aegrifaciens]
MTDQTTAAQAHEIRFSDDQLMAIATAAWEVHSNEAYSPDGLLMACVAVQAALLSKLRAPVADERAAQPPAAGRQYHFLKTDPEVFQAVLDGAKTFEIRMNDRGYAVGDALGLRETKHTGAEMRAGSPLEYTGRECQRFVSHVLTGYGLADGWCGLSFDLPHAGGESAPVAGEAQADLAPPKCPITGRPFFMALEHPELGMVPTYGGPYDSYTIPHLGGKPDQPWHERDLRVYRYDHDLGGWIADETEMIPLRIVHEDVLHGLEDAAPQASEADAAALSTAVDYRRMEEAPQASARVIAAFDKLRVDPIRQLKSGWIWVTGHSIQGLAQAAQPAAPAPVKDVPYKPMSLGEILAEYRKGCSNTLGEGPENCPECVREFVQALEALNERQAQRGDMAHMEQLRAALILARDSHGVSQLTDPPQDAWKARRVDEAIRAALSAQPEQS